MVLLEHSNALRMWVGGGCAVGAALGVGVVGAYASVDDAGRSRVAFAAFDALAWLSSIVLDPEDAHRLVRVHSIAPNALGADARSYVVRCGRTK